MSSQRGNVSRTRKQKFQNTSAFKNDLHDKSQKIRTINSLAIEGVCQRCKEKIEWKIKYKKYKPITQPSTCIRCKGKTVKRAYYIVCQLCATQAGVCAKCNAKQDIVIQPGLSDKEKVTQDDQLKLELQYLTERQRRSFFRLKEKGGAATLPKDVAHDAGDTSEDDDSETEDDDDCKPTFDQHERSEEEGDVP